MSDLEREVRDALDAGRQSWVEERDGAEQRILAEANIRESFGDHDTAAHLREMVEIGHKITDRYRD